MRLLLDDAYAPITSSIGFVEAPLEEVATAAYRWRREGDIAGLCGLWGHHKRAHPDAVLPPELIDPRVVPWDAPLPEWADLTASVAVEGPFPEILLNLEPLGSTMAQELFLETDSRWTAYFESGVPGDIDTPIRRLCRLLQVPALTTSCVPHTIEGEGLDATGRYGSVQFHLLSPECDNPLFYLRSIYAMNDGGPWVFGADGPVLPFERVERYRARRIRDRFTSEMLGEYCEALGIRYFDPTFYGSRGVLIRPRNQKSYGAYGTLAEARRKLDIGEPETAESD